MLGANLATGESTDCPTCAAKLDFEILWEPWEKRLNPADYLEELTRVPTPSGVVHLIEGNDVHRMFDYRQIDHVHWNERGRKPNS
jgi:hypothetical protein